MKTERFFAAFVALTFFAIASLHAEDKPDSGGWSADLLTQILKTDTPKPDNSSGAAAAPAAATGELVLHTYQLTHLRIGEAGKAQTMLTVLQRMLPPGSSIKPDIPANSLHVLTTLAAHKDFHDLITALDVPEAKSPLAAPAMPEEMKSMLKKLAETGDQSGKLAGVINSLKSDVANQMAQIDARQRQQTMRIAIGGGVVLLIVVVVLAVLLRRRGPPQEVPAAAVSTELVLAPEQLKTALMPAHDQMRNEMLGMLNEVAIKLQAQHNEQQQLIAEQHRQLDQARHAMVGQTKHVTEALTRVEENTNKLAEQNDKLAKQNDKIGEIATEWQRAVKELDETKDKFTKAQIELEQERAKIAALSILLEEGQLPQGGVTPPANLNGNDRGSADDTADAAEHSSGDGAAPNLISAPLPPCTQDQDQTNQTQQPVAMAAPHFQFLHPDHPES